MFKKTLLSVAVLGLVTLSASVSFAEVRDAGAKARGDMSSFWAPSNRAARVYRAPSSVMPVEATAAVPVERRFSAEPANPAPAPAVADANAQRVVRTYSAEPTTTVRARPSRDRTPLYLRSKGDSRRFDSH